MIDVANGDPERDRALRTALETLRERSDDPAFRDELDDVLAGRRGLREVALGDGFARAVGPAVERAVQEWEALPPGDRRALLARVSEQHPAG